MLRPMPLWSHAVACLQAMEAEGVQGKQPVLPLSIIWHLRRLGTEPPSISV